MLVFVLQIRKILCRRFWSAVMMIINFIMVFFNKALCNAILCFMEATVMLTNDSPTHRLTAISLAYTWCCYFSSLLCQIASIFWWIYQSNCLFTSIYVCYHILSCTIISVQSSLCSHLCTIIYVQSFMCVISVQLSLYDNLCTVISLQSSLYNHLCASISVQSSVQSSLQ